MIEEGQVWETTKKLTISFGLPGNNESVEAGTKFIIHKKVNRIPWSAFWEVIIWGKYYEVSASAIAHHCRKIG